jgi:uncharacterized protein with ATP-grasp and redox domains
MFRQIVEVSRMLKLPDEETKEIIGQVGELMAGDSFNMSPPEMAGRIHEIIRQQTGVDDIYRDAKEKSNRLAISVYDRCKERVLMSVDPLLTAVELAIAGNIIDFGVKNSLDVESEINRIVHQEQIALRNGDHQYFAIDSFAGAVDTSNVIVILADNAGETIFDRILIETIKKRKPRIEIIYGVKERPVLNDACIEDAYLCGINTMASVASTGSTIPGTVLHKLAPTFRILYDTADMVISKGQGNFESFRDAEKPVFYLFMAKCPVVADIAGCETGTFNLFYNKH